MISLRKFRKIKLNALMTALRRPRLFGWTSDNAVEFGCRSLLIDLITIDQLPGEHAFGTLPGGGHQFRWSSVENELRNYFPDVDSLGYEIASVYAEISYRLGYIPIAQVLTLARWRDLIRWYRNDSVNRNWSRMEIYEIFGNPSFLPDGPKSAELNVLPVNCYVGPRMEDGWFYFDFVDRNSAKLLGIGGARDRHVFDWVLRDIRWSKKAFPDGIRLTPFGRTL